MKKSLKKSVIAVLFALWICLSVFCLISCNGKDGKSIKYKFETNGGEAISTIEVDLGESVTLPLPEKEGYEFEGWYIDATFEGSPVTTVVAESSLTYYAKWAKLYTITLDVKDGSLSTKTVSLKVGANIYDGVEGYVPTKANAMFGTWLLDGAELGKNVKMPEKDITLVAKYKVAYAVEIWVENTESGEYEKTDEIVGYEYAGVEFTSTQRFTGLKEVSHANTLVKLELSEDVSENVFKHYFIRERIEVEFNPNYPDGSKTDSESRYVYYGEGMEVLSNYTAEGYCLIGWAKTKTGKLEYKANYIDSVLYNKEGESEKADMIYPDRDVVLYGVWAKGYSDMFGNDDYIYLLSEDSEVIYLSRGSVFFQGRYLPELNEFRFIINDEIKKGCLFDTTFAYSDLDRASTSCSLYQIGVGLVEDGASIVFDEYNGLTYYEKNGETGLNESSTGTYEIEDGIYYVATFNDGALAEKTITFIVGTVTIDGTQVPAFQLRNDMEYNLGDLYMFYVEDCELKHYESEYRLTLDGFGNAKYYSNQTTYSSYKYTCEDNVITLINNSGNSMGSAYLIELNGVSGYMFKNTDYAHTYEISNNASLSLDGLYTATYVNGDGTVEGIYMIEESGLGGYIVTMVSENDEVKKFLVNESTIEVPSTAEDAVEGETETSTVYSAVEKTASYDEYYYMGVNKIYFAPLLVLNDPVEGAANMYGYTAAKTYEKVADCTFEYDEDLGLYVFAVNPIAYSETVDTTIVDYATLKAFVCALDVDSTVYKVSCWYSSTTEDGEETDYRVNYTSENGATLLLVSGFAVYRVNDTFVMGPYSVSGKVLTIIATDERVYLEIDAENKTFIALTMAPYKAYSYINGVSDKNVYLSFDGKGGVTYTSLAKTEEEEDIVYVGSVEKLSKTTLSGATIYRFTSEELTFEYISLTASTTNYFARYDEAYNGIYESDDDGILALDGFGFEAKFTSAINGQIYEGRYTIDEENSVIVFQYQNETWYFDTDFDAKTFTLRGQEALTYLLVDNQLWKGLYLEMDGYGNLIVYKYEKQDGENVRVNVDEHGTYSIDGEVCTLNYVNGSDHFELVGEIGTYVSGGIIYRAFLISHKEVVKIFVNELDWSILILDDVGNAIKYNANGAKDTGKYTIVTEEMLYFVNDASTDACIYTYDKEKGTAIPISFTAVGYFTKDLESLLFSQYGFAIFNGTDYYYYKVVNSDYIIYRQDPTNEDANEYGFVEENFGKLQNVKEYNSKTYYQNTGYAITFNREESTKDQYPVLVASPDVRKPLEEIIFTPSGDGEFNVTCTVKLNGKFNTGTIVREIDEDGNVETYILITASLGYYRFDVNLNYTGEDADGNSNNTYEVVSMRWIRSIYSYKYLQNYYLYYSLGGYATAESYKNNIGMLYINQEYNTDGEGGDIYITSSFGEGSATYDTLGNIISIERGDYGAYGSYDHSKFIGEDGYTYHFYFLVQKHQAFQNAYGYRVYAMTREEVLTTEDGYEVLIERIVGSESSLKVGNVFNVKLVKGGEEITAETIMSKNAYVYYLVREKTEDGVVTSTKCYKMLLTEESSESLEEATNSKIVPLYASVSITIETFKTLYTEDGEVFVDISETEGVMLYNDSSAQYAVVNSVYDEATKSYTITLSNGKKYVVAIVEVEGTEKVTITEWVETEEESEETEEA